MILALLCSIGLATSAPEPAALEWLGTPPAKTRRLVSLAPALTELLFAIGAGGRVVGVTRFDNYPEQAATLPKVGGFIDPNVEVVLSLRPDLILAMPNSGGRGRVETMARLGVPVLIIPGKELRDLPLALKILGKTLGLQAEAQVAAQSFEQKLRDIREHYKVVPEKRTVILVGHRPMIAAGKGSYLTEVFAQVGARNILTRGGPYPTIDLEWLSQNEIDVVIDATMRPRKSAGVYWETIFKQLGRKLHVVPIENDALLRLGPRVPAAIVKLATQIHGAKGD